MGNAGLDGVVAASTALSHVDGERGELIIAGYTVADLAAHATFEETTWLLWHNELPSARQLEAFGRELAARRRIAPSAVSLLRDCAAAGAVPMDALRIAAGAISLTSDEAATVVAQFPTIVATHWRLLHREAPIEPRDD